MKKILILFSFFLLIHIPIKGQVIFQDSLVRITGYVSVIDSCLYFQIENISDSILILNDKNINFEKVRDNQWSADLSLLTSGLSLLQPSYGHFMSFKRLFPKQKYTAVSYNFPLPIDSLLFELFIQIDYLIIPSDIKLVNHILYKHFFEFVKDRNLTIHSYKGKLRIRESNNLCKFFLQSKSSKGQVLTGKKIEENKIQSLPKKPNK